MQEPAGGTPLSRNVPPILSQKNLRVLDVGTTENGNPYILLGADSGKYRTVSIYMLVDHPGTIHYGYTVFDPTTRTEITYNGRHGDPTKDRIGDIEGL